MILIGLQDQVVRDVLSEATRAGPIVLLISALNITARRQAAQTNKSRPRILFADDHAIFAATLRNFLENDICRRWSGSRWLGPAARAYPSPAGPIFSHARDSPSSATTHNILGIILRLKRGLSRQTKTGSPLLYRRRS
jgi:hypothetical protein